MRSVSSSRQPKTLLRNTATAVLFSALLVTPVLFSVAGCTGHDEDKPSEADMNVVRSNLLPSLPTPQKPVNADLDGKIGYLGMDFSPAVAEPGKPITLTHYWKSMASPGEGWKVFTHFEGPNHQGFFNADHGPISGKYPVDQWKAGEIIRDQYTVTLPANWTASSINVYAGVWRGQERLSVTSGPSDGHDRVLVGSIPVKKP